MIVYAAFVCFMMTPGSNCNHQLDFSSKEQCEEYAARVNRYVRDERAAGVAIAEDMVEVCYHKTVGWEPG